MLAHRPNIADGITTTEGLPYVLYLKIFGRCLDVTQINASQTRLNLGQWPSKHIDNQLKRDI